MTLNKGNVNGKYWIPAECDVSIRPGWFYHKAEDDKVKTPEQLFQLYLKSVGRGANLLLNVPPDGNGLISPFDSASLVGFDKLKKEGLKNKFQFDGISFTKHTRFKYTKKLYDDNDKTFVKIKGDKQNMIKLYCKTGASVNCIVLKEFIKKGQKITDVKIAYSGWGVNDATKEIKFLSTIGNQRITTFPKIKAKYIFITLTSLKGTPVISEVAAYLIDESLIEK
jgi:alpha-L-fucosidase